MYAPLTRKCINPSPVQISKQTDTKDFLCKVLEGFGSVVRRGPDPDPKPTEYPAPDTNTILATRFVKKNLKNMTIYIFCHIF